MFFSVFYYSKITCMGGYKLYTARKKSFSISFILFVSQKQYKINQLIISTKTHYTHR